MGGMSSPPLALVDLGYWLVEVGVLLCLVDLVCSPRVWGAVVVGDPCCLL